MISDCGLRIADCGLQIRISNLLLAVVLLLLGCSALGVRSDDASATLSTGFSRFQSSNGPQMTTEVITTNTFQTSSETCQVYKTK
jgi:hypothetical protein